ncbi:hypothetical protein Q3G72_020997 [Acer saccharum]|nr:hypothetical protein Q3G72_020997 [Acer saccharum]
MAGLSLAEFLKSPTSLNGPWKVYGSARRSMPTWFPSAAAVDDCITFDAADLTDTHEKLSPISGEVTHIFWVAIQKPNYLRVKHENFLKKEKKSYLLILEGATVLFLYLL